MSDISYETLVGLLRHRAQTRPEKPAYTFLADGEGEEDAMSYGALEARARAIACRLHAFGARGERVLLLIPPGNAYIAAFFACLYAGAVAVPAYPPRRKRNMPRIAAILADCRAEIALTTDAIKTVIGQLGEGVMPDLRFLTVEEVPDAEGADWRQPPGIDADTLAFIQYTSGSTGDPKGVMLSHGNLLHNQEVIKRAFGHHEGSTVAGWLPLYHDMGLIGNIFQPLYVGSSCVFMSPVHFLQRPVRWLEAISRFGATTSGGPNFAYDLCVDKIDPQQLPGIDLGSWTVAFNGSEPVRAATLDRFCAAFAPCGFRRSAFYPCYGLAEATLMVTCAGGVPVAERGFADGELAGGRAVGVDPATAGAKSLVGCGTTQSGVSLAIVDPVTLAECDAGAVGEIWVRGRSVGLGYWEQGGRTEEVFAARTRDSQKGPFLRTGDLGFIADGELFVTGRLKDLIIIRGRNHYPQDIEMSAEAAHRSLRREGAMAFSVEVAGEERLVVLQELEFRSRPDVDEVIAAIRQAVSTQHEIGVHAVALVKAGGLPRTSSGKKQRHLARARFLDGSLESIGCDVTERGADLPGGRERMDLSALRTMGGAGQQAYLEERLQSLVASVTGIDGGAWDARTPLGRLGVDSLQAVQLQTEVERDLGFSLPLSSFIEGGCVSLAATLVDALGSDPGPVDARASGGGAGAGEYPLSKGQQAIWFMEQLAPESTAYNIGSAVRVLGGLDPVLLRDAFQLLVDRHSALRTTFPDDDGSPVQRVAPRGRVDFRSVAMGAGELDQRLAAEINEKFDLTAGPLLRARLFPRPQGEFVLLLVIHHIIADSWSLAVIVRELSEAYQLLAGGGDRDWQLPEAQYAEFARRQADWLEGDKGLRQEAYWRARLAGELPALDLPTSRPRPPVQTYAGAVLPFRVDAETAEGLKALGSRCGATPYMTLLAAFNVLLYHYSGQTDILVGSPVAGRGQAKFADAVGYFVNSVVMRSTVDPGMAFTRLLAETRRMVLANLDNQEFPFSVIAEKLQPVRDPSRSPVFQVAFIWQNVPVPGLRGLTPFALGEEGARLQVGPLSLESVSLPQRTAQFDLTLSMGEHDGELAASFEYNTDLFDRETVERMAGHFTTLLRAVVEDPGRIDEIPVLTAAERGQLLKQGDGAGGPRRREGSVRERFERQARLRPDAVAVLCRGAQVTYGELDRRAEALARRLADLGVGPEAVVGVCADRSVAMLVAILGVLKANAAYLPLDVESPPERLAGIAADCDLRWLVVPTAGVDPLRGEGVEAVVLDEDGAGGEGPRREPAGRARPGNATCVIYTSGSTGAPKGVVLENGGVLNLIDSFVTSYAATPGDRILPMTSAASASFVGEVFPMLCSGGSVLLPDKGELLDIEGLVGLVRRDRVSIISSVPSLLAKLRDLPGDLAPLRLVLSGGEALVGGEVERLASRVAVVNGYGLTETTVCNTWHPLGAAGAERGGVIPIGRPLADCRVYVLGDRLQLVPAGCRGELYIAGAGLARGYQGAPGMTADRFVPDPHADGERMFRTGDQARWGAGGVLEFIGRLDGQVKIRGFRIELAEIEAVLNAHPDVRQAVVLARDGASGAKSLVAYIVADADRRPQPVSLRTWVAERLADHMVPRSYMTIGQVPLTANGKVDTARLPAVDGNIASEAPYVEPRGGAERTIAAIWQEVLDVERVGVNDNFFDIGGHSLLVAQVHGRLRKQLGPGLLLVDLFKYPTVRSLANHLQGGGGADEEYDEINARVAKGAQYRSKRMKSRKTALKSANA